MNPWPFFSEEEISSVVTVLQSGKVNYWTGEQGFTFEKEFAEYVGVKHAIAVSNGTAALELALYALDIGPGDEVIVPCRTFIATASCVVSRGAKPVPCDIDPYSQTITTETILANLTANTKAIIVVHLAGWPCEMDSIAKLAKEKNIYLIEDCAQSHGATYYNQQVGSLSDIAAFSFCQDKIMTTGGEGGMITTNNSEWYQKMWEFKDHGKALNKVFEKNTVPGFRWLHDSFGSNFRMTEMQAAIGRIQLKKLPGWIKQRQHNAALLNNALANCAGLKLTLPPDYISHAYYKYYCFLDLPALKPQWHQQNIMTEINQHGIPCYSGSCPEINREQAFIKAGFTKNNHEFNNAKWLEKTSLMFLVHPTLETNFLTKTAAIIKSTMQKAIK